VNKNLKIDRPLKTPPSQNSLENNTFNSKLHPSIYAIIGSEDQISNNLIISLYTKTSK
jgi:hypothetical protein